MDENIEMYIYMFSFQHSEIETSESEIIVYCFISFYISYKIYASKSVEIDSGASMIVTKITNIVRRFDIMSSSCTSEILKTTFGKHTKSVVCVVF